MLRSNPDLAERLLAQVAAEVSRAQAGQERIIRLMLEAALGISDEES